MDDDLAFLVASLDRRIGQLEDLAASEREGRGHRFVDLVLHLLDLHRLAWKRSKAGIENSASPAELAVHRRSLERLFPELDSLYNAIAHFHGDIGRQDLPVGLLHLVDVLVSELLTFGKVPAADPLVHLEPHRMYSTISLTRYFRAVGFKAPNPVVFNLPTLDSSNVLLAPILAHEVGHSAWWEGLFDRLKKEWNSKAIDAELAATTPSPEESKAWLDQFQGWAAELLCDCLAVVLAGPSLLFSLLEFSPYSSSPPPGTHPYKGERVRACLDLLDDLGWTPFLVAQVPQIHAWANYLAGAQQYDSSRQEQFLLGALKVALPAIRKVAVAHVKLGVEPSFEKVGLEDAIGMLTMGIPPVELSGIPISTWQAVLSGWTSELRQLGGRPEDLVSAASNQRLNLLLLKTIELSNVVSLWRPTP